MLKKRLFRMIALFLLVVLLGNGVWIESVYQAKEQARRAMQGTKQVSVSSVKEGYLFDGPGSERALVFYPGALIEETAYAPLLLRIAERGTDCFLLHMPFRMALLNINAAEKLTAKYNYSEWIIGGHSLGGVAASRYAIGHPDQTKTLLLLASYPDQTVPDTVPIISVYGTEDHILNRQAYEISRAGWPENAREYILKGGNHAQFGDYGEQSGDGAAKISPEQQWDKTADFVRFRSRE